jgi:hypothetical protein
MHLSRRAAFAIAAGALVTGPALAAARWGAIVHASGARID